MIMDTQVHGEPPLHLPVLYHEVLNALNPQQGILHRRYSWCWRSFTRYPRNERSGWRASGFGPGSCSSGARPQDLKEFGKRAHLVQCSYLDMGGKQNLLGWKSVDGILLDLGLSSMQLDSPEKGFSFRTDAPLDMRFNPKGGMTAADLVNGLSKKNCCTSSGNLEKNRMPAGSFAQYWHARPIHTTMQLADLIEKGVGKSHKGIHPATRTFQALRIAVNDELGSVKSVLPQAIELLDRVEDWRSSRFTPWKTGS